MKKQILLIAIVLLSASCKKYEEKPVRNENMNRPATLNAVNFVTPGNSLNPYDSIGYWHNNILDFINQQINDTGQHGTDEIGNAIAHYPGATVSLRVIRQLPVIIAEERIDQEDNFRGRIMQSPYDAHTRNYLLTLMNIIEDTGLNYLLLKANITALENQVLKDPPLKAGEIKVILEAASIGRYSAWYWTYSNAPVAISLRLKNIIRWVAVVTTDIASMVYNEYVDTFSIKDNAAEAAGESADAGDYVTYSLPAY